MTRRLELRRDHHFRRGLHVIGHEGIGPGYPIGIAGKPGNHRGIFRHHDEIKELVGIVDVYGVVEQRHRIHPHNIAFARVTIVDIGVLQPRPQDCTVPID